MLGCSGPDCVAGSEAGWTSGGDEILGGVEAGRNTGDVSLKTYPSAFLLCLRGFPTRGQMSAYGVVKGRAV